MLLRTLFLALVPILVAANPAILREGFIYENAPFEQCHASTIEQTPDGLAAAWFGGSRERNPDVGIWFSRLVDGRWTPPVEVADGLQYTYTDGSSFRYATWNPVLFQPKNGPLLLFYKVGATAQQWWGMMKTSSDGGRTWSEARRLPPGILGPIKNKPIELEDGTILCPTSDETLEIPSYWRVYFETTTDFGRTWAKTRYVNDGQTISAIQPSLLEHGNGRLQALGRTRQQRIFSVRSNDNGRTWGEMELTNLPNSNSGTDAVTLRDGTHLLVYNHAVRGRSPLNLARSRDGVTWEAVHVFEREPGEYSYPAIIQSDDGLVHVTYTWKRERVKHIVLDPARMSGRPIVNGVWPSAR